MKLPSRNQYSTRSAAKPAVRRPGTSLAALGVLIFIASALLFNGAVLFLDSGYQEQFETQRSEIAKSAAANVAAQFSQHLQIYIAPVTVLAQDPALVEAVSTNDRLKVKDSEQQIGRLLPQAMRVRIIRIGEEHALLGNFPSLSFADLALLTQAQTTGAAPAIEAHAAGMGEQHFDVVVPITDMRGKTVIASVLVSYDLQLLQQLLGEVAIPGGHAEIVQVVNNERGPLLASSAGKAASNNTSLVQQRISGTQWRVAFSPDVNATLTIGKLYSIIAAVVLILAALIGLSTLFLVRGLRDDLKMVVTVVRDVWQIKKIKSHYPARLAIFRNTLDLLATMGEGLPLQSSQSRVEASEAAVAVEETEVAQGDRMNIEVSEQGENAVTQVSPSIFKAYDIRGIVDDTLNEEIVYNIGRAIGSEAYARGQQSIVVARDGRLSGPSFVKMLIKGLIDTGRDVIDIGMVPTPVLYFATHYLSTGSGVMLTGSHNPPNYNGFKIVLRGETLSGDDIQALRKRIEKNDMMEGKGELQEIDITSDYIERVISDVKLKRPLKLIVDCGNGVSGMIAPRLLRTLGCEVTEMYCDVDGHFPNHHPDPSQPDNLSELIDAVRAKNADLGLAYDGDGDRIGVVDSKGIIIWPDRQMMLYAEDVLSRNPGAEIIFDIKCSRHLGRVISERGGKPLMWKTGHSLIKKKLKESDALLAGEMSGHIFFKERWYGFDDALYTTARLLEILAARTQSSGEVFAALPDAISTPELKIEMREGEHHRFMKRFIAEAQFPGAAITTIDGLRADFEDGWGLVRASNTTPCLVVRFEANSPATIKKIQEAFRKILLKLDPKLVLPF